MRAGILAAAAMSCLMGMQAWGQQTLAAPTAENQEAAAQAPAAPAPLPTPSLTGPLQWLPPAVFDAGPLGKLSANGIVSGYGLSQNNPMPGDSTGQAT
ncbi:MAG: hypothetical protein ACLGQU_05600, partial [Acidobacteriota bacterium]